MYIHIFVLQLFNNNALQKEQHTQKSCNNKEALAAHIIYTAYSIRTEIIFLLKDYALSPEQYNILRILKEAYPEKVCVKQIAKKLMERNANVPRTVDKLVVKKLVKRLSSSTDKRETRMEISIAGIKLLETINPLMEKTMNEICGLNKNETSQLYNLLDKYRKE